jgi:uncharacterized protein (DUF2235 family)
MPGKSIILCFDGTWNTPSESASPSKDDSTNVVRFFERVCRTAPDGRQQVKWYNPGVGTEWGNRIRGGAFGLGLDVHIMEGYRELIKNYQEGDDVYLVGFSRGAYTARSLVGLVRNCGLLCSEDDRLIERAYAMYRSRDDVDSEDATAFRRANSRKIPIKFVGVWDTVGALGVPLHYFRRFDAQQYSFHDTKLSSMVQNAFHALAVDEHREPFAATLWGPQDSRDRECHQVVEQVWFSGSHGDIGGGYPGSHPISDLTLRWMQKKAAGCGMAVEYIRLPPEYAVLVCELHDSFRHFLVGAFRFFRCRYYRAVGQAGGGPQAVDISVGRRMTQRSDYRPKNEGLLETAATSDAW